MQLDLVPYPRDVELDPSGKYVKATIRQTVTDKSLPPQGYRITADEDGVVLAATDRLGLVYARTTLKQMVRLYGYGSSPDNLDAGTYRDSLHAGATAVPGTAETSAAGRAADLPSRSCGHTSNPDSALIPACRITDWPDFRIRSVLLDISRTKVPTLNTLDSLVTLISALKFNQLHLYMEHTFAYTGHREVWEGSGAYTEADIARIQAKCEEHGIDLVPHQNTLGHMERWLIHERYRQLAIKPEGFYWLFGIERKATTLDPENPEASSLVAGLLNQLLPLFDSPFAHVGMDEPWELPPSRSGQWIGWLKHLKTQRSLRDRRVMVWGDYLSSNPHLIAELPEDTIVCEWGYDAGHPFSQHLEDLAAHNIPTFVCPGTSSWLSLTGRSENALSNIADAAKSGMAYGSQGFMICDWGDMGHHQQLPVMYPALVAGAALSWCYDSNSSIDLSQLGKLTGLHLFDKPRPAIGSALVSLGQAHRMVVPQPPNMSALTLHLWLPQFPVGSGLTTGLTQDDLDRVTGLVNDTINGLPAIQEDSPDSYVLDEILLGASWLKFAIRDAHLRLEGNGGLPSIPERHRTKLASDLSEILATHTHTWLQRNRAGGLDESSAWIGHLLYCYRNGTVDPKWFGPLG
ncbi:MAG: family 20 glycosylhydrolase [Acidimicrobiales bacterium]